MRNTEDSLSDAKTIVGPPTPNNNDKRNDKSNHTLHDLLSEIHPLQRHLERLTGQEWTWSVQHDPSDNTWDAALKCENYFHLHNSEHKMALVLVRSDYTKIEAHV